MTPFQKILERYRKYSFSQVDKGNRFERLMQAYLLTDPKYASRLDKVWLWSEFPGKLDFGGHDIRIDLYFPRSQAFIISFSLVDMFLQFVSRFTVLI
ncbi:MAG: hypothetical protein GX371_07395 [Bacteroidales bacterium]|nr:hypothetical protein [Bacteroidales bacterium]